MGEFSPTDIQILGEQTAYEAVRGSENDTKSWLANQPLCPLLAHHDLEHVGLMRAEAPFEVTRYNQSGTFMLSCFKGSGLVLVDGSWHRIRAGEACLLPPFVMNSLRCEKGSPWHFTWVRYLESCKVNPIVSARSPIYGKFPSNAMQRAIQGLCAEAGSTKNATSLQLWIELVQSYVTRFARPYQSDSRLFRVWNEVELAPGKPWTLAELASLASVSEEHLRRLCKKELGRSPMQHVIFLRIQKACHLLSTSDQKIESIAQEVGYQSPFTFSATFKRRVGRCPSEHRKLSGKT